jgi:hypothetical protein
MSPESALPPGGDEGEFFAGPFKLTGSFETRSEEDASLEMLKERLKTAKGDLVITSDRMQRGILMDYIEELESIIAVRENQKPLQ